MCKHFQEGRVLNDYLNSQDKECHTQFTAPLCCHLVAAFVPEYSR